MRHIEDTRIAITGTGICSAIGMNVEEVVESLQNNRSGIRPFHGDGIEQMTSRYAARIVDFQLDDRFPEEAVHWWDKATQMAAVACREAIDKSRLLDHQPNMQRIGMAVGMSGAGQFSPDRNSQIDGELTRPVAELIGRRNTPHFQLYQLARFLRLNGPMVCVSSASSGSGIAIANAVRWLLAKRADAVIAGGGEAIQLLNFLGFDTLGLLSPNPCSPFSRSEGMTMGEGAGFVVLERLQDAIERQATIHGALLGIGITSDAFDPILYDPSGDGIRRAMQSAIADAGLERSQIGWIRTSGAGNRDQDASEIMAIRELFGDQLPVVTSTEAHHGHCNGAGPAMGFVAALESQRKGWIPATLNFANPSPASLDFVPNAGRSQSISYFLSTTAAFGGSNVVLVGSTELGAPRRQTCEDVFITGIGVVGSFGCSASDFARAISSFESRIRKIARHDVAIDGHSRAGLVQDFNFRREFPSVPGRGLDLLSQYCAVAVSKALQEAQRTCQPFDSDRLGVATGLSQTSGSSLERLLDEIKGPWATPAIGRTLLNKGRFIVTSRLAKWFSCRGYNATYSGGIGVGQVAFNQAFEQLRQCDQVDAIVVVAADEVSRIRLRIASALGWLANDEHPFNPYCPSSDGMVLGEGAVAIVLERKQSALKRGAPLIAQIDSTACSLDQQPIDFQFPSDRRGFQIRTDSPCFEFAVRDCINRSTLSIDTIDVALGSACGIPAVDDRDRRLFERVSNGRLNPCTSATLTGFAISSTSLLNTALLATSLSGSPNARAMLQAIGGLASADQPVRAGLIAASSEDGHNVVTLLKAASTDRNAD